MIDSGIFQLIVELAGINALSEFFASLSDLNQAAMNTLSIVGVFTLIFGVLQCFFGYKLFRFWCSFVGFMIGAIIGLIIVLIGYFTESNTAMIFGGILALALGILGAVVAFKAYSIGVFIYFFVSAYPIGFFIVGSIANSAAAGFAAGVITGIIMGIIGFKYREFWIVLATSLSGGVSTGIGVLLIMHSTNGIIGIVISVVLLVAGIVIQRRALHHNTIEGQA